MNLMTVPLARLSIDEAANVRKTNRGAEKSFAASIRKLGVIYPLTVRESGDGYTITDGGKRFASLQYLLKKGEITSEYPVPVNVRDEKDASARETSLAANIIRVPMHPVDEYEAFAALVADGQTEEQIAATYVLEPKEVRQVLALGRLAPCVLAAWRAEEITEAAAQVFTMAGDHADQEAAFKKAKKRGNLDRYALEDQIVGDANKTANLVEYVGLENYIAAGGKITEDLFEGGHAVHNPALAMKLADAKLAEECKRLVEIEGWGWAEPADTLPPAHRWQWMRPIVQKDVAKKDRAAWGCALSINSYGKLVTTVLAKPEQAKAERKKAKADDGGDKAKAEEKKPETIPGGLSYRLSESFSRAVATALSKQPDLAVAIAAAALIASYNGCVVKISNNGHGWSTGKEDIKDFESAFAEIMKRRADGRLSVLAGAVGSAIDFTSHAPGYMPGTDEDTDGFSIIARLDGKEFSKALSEEFNAGDYFSSAPKKFVLDAISEAIGADQAKAVANKSKAEIAEFAVSSIPKTGWLPPQLRTEHYRFTSKKKTAKK